MGLTERITDPRRLRAWYGEIPIQQQYTVGPAGERFLREIRDNGRFMGTHCPQCDLLYLPPRSYCERCYRELSDWRALPNRGWVHAFTLVYQDLEGKALAQPQIYAVIEIEGAHGGLIHRLGQVEPEEVYIGMPVAAVFQPKGRRTGSILDIKHFRPA